MLFESKTRSIYRSTIQAELIHTSLKRGTLLSGFGAFLLLIGGTLLPLEFISLWGIPFFLIGIFFISIGLLPYRKLSRLQFHPHEIHYDGESLLFLKENKPLFKVFILSIEKITYLEREHLYGIGIWLKKPTTKKIKVLQPHFHFAAFIADSMHRFEGCDLFLPFFTKRVFEELNAQIVDDN